MAQLSNGYEPDDDEDMEADFEDDQGSSTDPYNSKITNDETNQVRESSRGSNSFGVRASSRDGDSDVDVYIDEDEDDQLDGIDTDGGNDPAGWGAFGQGQQPVQQTSSQPRPEDIPWAGIEDHMSDSENVDPDKTQSQSQSQSIEIHEDGDIDILDRDDTESGQDSQPPSEYSSKQNAWPTPIIPNNRSFGNQVASGGGEGSQSFQIHEDETPWA